LEFPGDLKYSRQFCHGAFDGTDRPAVYDVEQVQAFCRELNEAAQRRWVILSGGVAITEFLANLELAAEAGASGFLCGRAIWKDVVPKYPNLDAMRTFLSAEGVYNFSRANVIAQRARPWFAHPRFGEWANVQLVQAGERWYQQYYPTFGSVR
jgi:tagatose 1,6-diphosphate aldolase